MTQKKIYIYQDLGASTESLKHLKHFLLQIFNSRFSRCSLTVTEIIQGRWIRDAKLLIIPGGADVHYHSKLKGRGNKIIKNYVAQGGNYLGICAGAYYGATSIEFDTGGPLQITEERELAFFLGKAIGPLVPYSYNSNKGARAMKLRLASPMSEAISSNFLRIYYNGGPFFKNADLAQNTEILAYYDDPLNSLRPAIIKIQYNKGVVILSGVHFEYTSELLDQDDIYYAKLYTQLKDSEATRIKFAEYLLQEFRIT